MKSSPLTTEQQNENSQDIDKKSSLEILQIMNHEDTRVPKAIKKILPSIARFVDEITERLLKGGRLIYLGAGTSGRLGVLDASECPPTFGVSPDLVQALIAGGADALVRSVENAEDDAAQAILDLKKIRFNRKDVLVGITASGSAPYVLSALEYANTVGAVVGAISCNAQSEIFARAQYTICAEVGPEIIAGSTRLKSGTAQKLILNMLSTATMIKLGKVYGNLMVDVVPVNKKLVQRSENLIMHITNCDERSAKEFFAKSGKRPKVAIVMYLLNMSRKEAEALLEKTPHLRSALENSK